MRMSNKKRLLSKARFNLSSRRRYNPADFFCVPLYPVEGCLCGCNTFKNGFSV